MLKNTFCSLLKHPGIGVFVSALIILVLGSELGNFRFDASSESLVIEGDQDFATYQQVKQEYGSDEFLVVTWKPRRPLFSNESLESLGQLQTQLKKLPKVESVTSLLNVPMLQSPPISYNDIARADHYLQDDGTDFALAQQELATSPLYQELLVNKALTIAALIVELQTHADDKLLKETVFAVRGVVESFKDQADIHLGGVPMVAVDMLDYVRHDLKVFGAVTALLIFLLIELTFSDFRWVVATAVLCGAVTTASLGLLGWMDWPVTVVSSNFVALTLIITLSMAVHLIVRYRELARLQPQQSHSTLLFGTLLSKFSASAFTMLTTIVAFTSLLLSGIQPVMDFGLMMACALLIAFVSCFTLFPVLLMLLGKPSVKPNSRRDWVGQFLAATLIKQGAANIFLWLTVLVMLVVALVGTQRLSVENRFIDYFSESTEIYQGMLLLDRELGGTTPLDIVISAPPEEVEEEWGGGGLSANSYWYNEFEIAGIARIHEWLEALPVTGKVLSLHTTFQLLTSLNGGRALDNFSLALIYQRMPEPLKQQLIAPYLSADGQSMHFSVRIKDSMPGLERDALLKLIQAELPKVANISSEQLTISGMLRLYNNVLQSLFNSQIETLGVVLLAIGLMFWLLFRGLKIAVIAVVPTTIAAFAILGVMGLLGIPLNIMTITIAALTVGIGVDDTIHYVHRYKEEIKKGLTAHQAAKATHLSVGRAMVFTSVTIAAGFGVLAASAFVPSVYFGVFTALAMLLALLTNTLLLPSMLRWAQPHRLIIDPEI